MLSMTHPVSFSFIFFSLSKEGLCHKKLWLGGFQGHRFFVKECRFVVSTMFCRSVSVWTSFRWNTGRFPSQARLISCQLAWQPSRLHGSGLAQEWTWDSSWILFLIFFIIRGKRSWEKYVLALPSFSWLFRIRYFDNKNLAQLSLLVCCVGNPEQLSSLPEELLRLNCSGSEIFFILHWASLLSIFRRPPGANIFSPSLFSRTRDCIAVSLYLECLSALTFSLTSPRPVSSREAASNSLVSSGCLWLLLYIS